MNFYFIPPNVALNLKKQKLYSRYVKEIKSQGYKRIKIADNRNMKGDIDQPVNPQIHPKSKIKRTIPPPYIKKEFNLTETIKKSPTNSQTFLSSLFGVLYKGQCSQIKRMEKDSETYGGNSISIFLLDLSFLCADEYYKLYTKEEKNEEYKMLYGKNEEEILKILQMSFLMIWSKCLGLNLESEKFHQIKSKIMEIYKYFEESENSIKLNPNFYISKSPIFQSFRDMVESKNKKNVMLSINNYGQHYGSLWKFLKEEKKDDIQYLYDAIFYI